MAINMYRVTVGSNQWYYTSGEYDVSTGIYDYLAKPLKRTDLSFDMSTTEVTLTIPGDLAPFELFKYSTPLIPFTVEIMEYPSMNSAFTGNVLSCSFDSVKGIAKVKLGSNRALDGSTAPARTFGTTCSYELFSSACGVSKASHAAVIGTGSMSQTDNVLYVPGLGAYGATTFSGGYLETTEGESQYIVSQSSDYVTLLGSLTTLGDSSAITFYKGCDKQHTTCNSKFGNIARFGGFPFIPFINPYSEGF